MVADGARPLAAPFPGGSPRPEVNSSKQEMDTSFYSPIFGGITNTPSTVESPQLYSSWSTCGDDASTVASLHDSTKKRTEVNLSYSFSGPDTFGLVANTTEEPYKQESASDWNSLSRLFPPLWPSDFENSSSFSGIFPMNVLGNDDLASLVDSQNSCKENLQKPSSVELIRKEFDDLHVVGTWGSPGSLCIPSPEDILKNADTENKPFKSNGINHLGSFVCVQNYDTNRNESMPSSHSKITESTKGGIWDPVNNLCHEGYTGFADTHGGQQFSYLSAHFLSPVLNEENNFPEGMDTKLQGNYPQNCHSSNGMTRTFHNNEHKVPLQPQKGSWSQPSLKPSAQNMKSSYNGYTWLDTKILNPVAASCIPYGKQEEMSPIQSRGHPTEQSITQLSYSQKPPASSSMKEDKLRLFTNIPNSSGFSSSAESQKQDKPVGHPHNHFLAATEGYRGKISVNASSRCLSQQHSINEFAKHHRFQNMPNRYDTDERTGHNERRQRYNSVPRTGYIGMDNLQFNVWGRKQQNGAALSDFINPFLPLFPLVSGYKHMPSFPPFNLHPFSSPANIAFSPLPFPLAELADLLRYDDFPHLNPSINDLLGGDITPSYFAFLPPPNHYRSPKNRSGPANELHMNLEECYEQWRALERERKKTEADLARSFPGKRVSISSNAPFSRLPAKPSRVDRLIVDQFREQARVHSAIVKMEHLCRIPIHGNISATLGRHLEAICATQARRKEEIVNAVNPQRLGASRYNNEKDVLALAAAIKDLAFFTRKTRTALWCAFQMTLPKTSPGTLVQKEEVTRALQELCPVNCGLTAKTFREHEDKENKRGNPNGSQQAVK